MPIIDTSLVMAYLLNEPAAPQVLTLLEDGDAQAPDLLRIEVANALVTAVRRQRLTAAQAPPRCAVIASLPIRLHSCAHLADRALAIALAHQRRPYDGLFVALAESRDTHLLTLDRKLVQGLAGTPLAGRVRVLGE